MGDDTAIRAAAQRYMSRDWAIIAVYGVTPDRSCRCGRTGCASPGKHPVGGDWVSRSIGSPEELPPGSNIGLRTGRASGAFALDVDPKNGGDLRLAELEAEHGPLPPTWAQSTGSGGGHFLFALPEDFTPTNSRGRLPVGLDIRGEGGQIVLAPSVSAVGPYLSAETAGQPAHDVAPAPQWLLELIRPLPPIEIPAGLESAFMPEAATGRGQAYAQGAAAGELDRLRQAVPGERNDIAFRVACRIIELANAPWSGIAQADAASWYAQAGAAVVDADFTERELWRCWNQAAREVREKAAVLPAPPGGAPVALDWGGYGGPPVAPPFSAAGGDGASALPALAPGADPFDDALPWMGPAYPLGAPAPVVPVQAVPFGALPVEAPPANPIDALLLPRSQISRIPRPVPLIQGTLWRDTDSWLIGASGSGKSFVALDWAAHVASGRQWNNRRTVAGRVVYLAAEGAAGIQQRLDAWELAAGQADARAAEITGGSADPVVIPDDFIVLPAPVQAIVRDGRAVAFAPGWRHLMAAAARLRPALIVLDTQARISLGVSENDNAEMGQFIEAVGALRRESGGACVLVVHHTGRSGGDARGASAIDGAQDVEWKVVREKGGTAGRLVMEKNKNGADGLEHPFTLVSHRLGWDPEAGEEVTSLTVDWSPLFSAGAEPEHRTLADQVRAQILEVLREGSLASGATRAEIRRKVNKLRADRGLTPAGERTIDYALDSEVEGRTPGLVQSGLVTKDGQRFADSERYEQQV
jgi:DNA-binding transcriptional ArsR family regulator